MTHNDHAFNLIDLCGGLIEEPQDTPKCEAYLTRSGIIDKRERAQIFNLALEMQEDTE